MPKDEHKEIRIVDGILSLVEVVDDKVTKIIRPVRIIPKNGGSKIELKEEPKEDISNKKDKLKEKNLPTEEINQKKEEEKDIPKTDEIKKEYISKLDEIIQKIRIPKDREVKQMSEELLEEKKFEDWAKKQKFHENITKAAEFAKEAREEIPTISKKIENLSGDIKNVEGRLGFVGKSVEDMCTGIDCIKEDMKKNQEQFQNLEEKIKKLELPTYMCDNCGEYGIKPLSSYCPNCGSPIHQWTDESGRPIAGWIPYWKRIGLESPTVS